MLIIQPILFFISGILLNMGLVFFIPFGLFVGGVVSSDRGSG
ncbi:MAG TPA: hypothetical protein VMC09_03140 [Anaerolineales bacterium]|nr:hypothetical protein [Anaerolineales bacterium]